MIAVTLLMLMSRRDPEVSSGWYSIGHFGDQVFADADAALSQAKASVHWLAAQL